MEKELRTKENLIKDLRRKLLNIGEEIQLNLGKVISDSIYSDN